MAAFVSVDTSEKAELSLHKRLLWWLFAVVYTLSSWAFVHFYEVMTPLWVSLPRYLAGTERLPYQTRILPLAFFWPLLHDRAILKWMMGQGWHPGLQASAAAQMNAFFLWSLLSFWVASFYCLKLYRAVSIRGGLSGLALMVFLYLSIWSYTLHVYRNLSYPYDLSGLAFFTAGVFYIYQRRFVPLAIVMLVGTFNRETTLFLVLIYVIDGMWQNPAEPRKSVAQRLSQVSWSRTLFLFVIWIAIWLFLAHLFSGNDHSETYDRFRQNFEDISLKHLPGMLNMCGFVLPAVWILRKYVHPARFGSYANFLPFWLLVMAWKGLLLESRVHGELSGYLAVACVLLLERYVAERNLFAPSTTT